MNTFKTYSTPDGIYILERVAPLQVETHCHQYMDSIAGVVFHESEIDDLKESMCRAITSGIALTLLVGDIEVAYLYMEPVGHLRYNVLILHYIVPTLETQTIMEHIMYSVCPILRYVSKDPSGLMHKQLMEPMSVRMFIESHTDIIKMIRNPHTQDNLTTLNIKEV